MNDMSIIEKAHQGEVPSVQEGAVCGSKLRIKKDVDGFLDGGLRTKHVFKQKDARTPLVTVITVCLNSARTIGRCIQSVLSQTYANVEYIVIDGASTDGTVSIIRDHEHEIDYFVSEADSGLYSAMNKGLCLARGDFLMLLNSDDWYTDDCVQTLIDARNDKQVDVVSALADYVDENGELQFTTQAIGLDGTTLIRNPLRHETMLVPAAIYNKFGPYDESYRVIADFQFIIKLYEAGVTHYTVSRSLMCFRNTGVSSTDMTALFRERKRILEEQFPYVNTGDLDVLCDLSKLKQSDVGSILQRNKIFPKFHAALLAFSKARWRFQDKFLAENDTSGFGKDYLRIETFTTNAGGGAGTGSRRRIEALSAIGVDVGLNALFASNGAEGVNILTRGTGESFVVKPAELVSTNCFINRSNTPGFSAEEMFSSHRSVLKMTDLLPEINRADVLHFHWMSGLLDYDNFDLIADKPIVWTLADMAAFTGGCHYAEGCEGYKTNCSGCKLVGPNSGIVEHTWQTKRKAYEKLNNLTVICPSRWLADKAAESELFKRFPIKMIPNPVPLSRFFPVNKMVARVKLGLALERKYVLFGAENLTNRRKGGDLLVQALEVLKKTQDSCIEILTFGYANIELPFPQVKMGFCADEDTLRLIYSAADVFAFPSKEDNSPLTVSEAMACGTPVISFPVGNVPELVTHKVNGYVARVGDVADFAKGVEWAFSGRSSTRLKRSLSGVIALRKNNDPMVSAHRHLELYRAVSNGRPRVW